MGKHQRMGAACILGWAVVVSASVPMAVVALDFTIPLPGDQSIAATLNTTITAGGGIRMQGRADRLIGKSNLNPNVCTGPNGAYQSCQGLFKDQIYPAQVLFAAPGAASINGDDGDLDTNRHQLFQAVSKATQDLTLTYGNFGFFGRTLFFYDFVNNDKTEYHPNRITADNYLQVGRQVAPAQNQLPGAITNPANLLALQAVQAALLNNRNYGQLAANGNYIVYGPGGVVRNKRTDGVVLSQAGTNLQYLDSYIYGKLPLWGEKELTFKLGRQLVNWGESTTLAINSINQANPVNANNLYRIGSQVEEVFTPINMVFASFEPIDNVTTEGFYQLEWKNVEAPSPGTYFSDIDIGTNNAGAANNANAGFGGTAEDPQLKGTPLDNPLAGITPTTGTLPRLPDREPHTSGQYGIKLGYYADWLNGGTDLAGYFMNYHSRLPYASFYAAYPSCARREGNAFGRNVNDPTSVGNDANNTAQFFLDCPDVPVLHAITATGTSMTSSMYAKSSAVEFDSARLQLEYPEDIHLLGASFSTTVGDYSIQGEVAYRPNLPLQVDTQDLGFAAFGPTLTRCHEANLRCTGSSGGVGFTQNGGTTVYGPSNFTPAAGGVGYPDTFDLAIGNINGSARAFPNFVIPYRGGTLGENTPCYPQPGSADDVKYGFSGFQHPYYPYNPNSPCYIRGYQRMQVYEFNLGATRVLGATDNPFGASQIVLIFEGGAEYVPFLPGLDQLVLEGPNTNYGPTAGADGSGADGSRRACSTNPSCSVGPDGLRFNPHQQDPTGYPDAISWGYRLIAQIKYESILPGVALTPFIIFRQDVQGTAPSPAPNFVAGRKEVDMVTEFRYKSALSLNLGYTWYWGGGDYNTMIDRDFAQFFVKYQF